MATEVGKEIINANVSGTYTVECQGMHIVWADLTITGDTTIKLNGTKTAQSIYLCIRQDGAGGHTIEFDLDQFETVGGIQPSFSTVADELSNFIFMGGSDGTSAHEHSRSLGVK